MKIGDQPEILEYQIALSDDGSYIRNTIFVDVTNKLIEKFSEEIVRLKEETGAVKFIVDVSRVRSAQSATDMYVLTYNKLTASRSFRAIKIAIVTHPGDNSHDFMETLFVNNCVTGKIFRNEGEAVAWLKE